MKRTIFFTTLLLLMALAINIEHARAEIGVTNDEIIIGSTMDLSGPVAFAGQSLMSGALLYFNYINENGGIHGRKIKFMVEDDGFQAPRTVQAVKKLVAKDNIFCMTMNIGANNLFAALPFIEANNVPVLPIGSANELLAIPPRKNIFVMDTGYTIQGKIAVQYMIKSLKVTRPKVAVIYQDDVTGKQWLSGVKTACAEYGVNVLELSYKRGAIDFSSQMAQCKINGITHVFAHLNIREPAAIMKEAQRIQYRAVYIVDNICAEQKAIELAGDAVDYTNGFYAMGIINDIRKTDSEGYRLYKEACKKANLSKTETENALRIWAFNAALTLCEVLNRAGKNLTREGFIKAAETLKDYSVGIEVPITWKPDRRDGGRAVKVYKAEKGYWVSNTEWISI